MMTGFAIAAGFAAALFVATIVALVLIAREDDL